MHKNLEIAIDAALKAGKEIMKIYEDEDFQIQLKGDESPLTIADSRANNIILAILKETGIPVISEENKLLPFSVREKWNLCWIVDPLDGTKEFIKKNGEFTVNIALIEKGEPLLGVIFVPASQVLYYALVKEKSSYKVIVKEKDNLERLFKRSEKIFPVRDEEKIRVVGSRSHMNEETLNFIENLKENQNGNIEIVSKGSSLKFCLVAEGKADVYPRFAPTMEWDTAAGQAICEAVGLQVIDSKTGKNMKYNRQNLLNNYFLISNFGKST